MILFPKMSDIEGTAVPLPDGWIESVVDFHRLAYSVVAQARYEADEWIRLMSACGGFGTPKFKGPDGAQRCICVVGDRIYICPEEECDLSSCESEQITTLAAAAAFVGIAAPGTDAKEHDGPEVGDIDAPLKVSEEVGRIMGWWHRLGTAVLAEFVAGAGSDDDPEDIVLWPGHLDIGSAVGAEGKRASYGLSPGDHSHDEPYAYVGAWGEVDRADTFWNDPNFQGASLAYADLIGIENPAEVVLDFMRIGYEKLAAS